MISLRSVLLLTGLVLTLSCQRESKTLNVSAKCDPDKDPKCPKAIIPGSYSGESKEDNSTTETQGEPPESKKPETLIPDQGKPDSGSPGSGNPSSNFPDSGYPNSNFPNSGNPSSNFPNSGYPNSNFPNSGNPSSNFPDSGYPNSNYPNSGNPTYPQSNYPNYPTPNNPNFPDSSNQESDFPTPNLPQTTFEGELTELGLKVRLNDKQHLELIFSEQNKMNFSRISFEVGGTVSEAVLNPGMQDAAKQDAAKISVGQIVLHIKTKFRFGDKECQGSAKVTGVDLMQKSEARTVTRCK